MISAPGGAVWSTLLVHAVSIMRRDVVVGRNVKTV